MKKYSIIKKIGFAVGVIIAGSVFAATQQIPLEAGWNLISLQVCPEGIDVTKLSSCLDDPVVLKSVWDYDVETGKWNTYQPDYPEASSGLTRVVPGKGYWVKVYNACVLTIEGEPWEGAVTLCPGWNLVGFPGLTETDIASAFQDSIDNVQQIWEFEGGHLGKFAGYDTSAVPKRKDILSLVPGKGYWVYAIEALHLAPEPEILLTGDYDLPPLQTIVRYEGNDDTYRGRDVKYCGDEDKTSDLNGNGILDDSWTQDTMSFGSGVYRLPVIIHNASNCGVMNWTVEENCNWLSIEGEASGTLASGQKHIYLVVDKSDLPAGVYSNASVVVKAGNISKTINIIMHVANVSGDFSGYASATKVNGKNIPLGKVDMGLNIFMQSDDEDETRFKAVVDRDVSLLFPRDVFMNGVFYYDNYFSMTTSFSMPAGDRNAPPYDTFRHVDPAIDQEGTGDKDWNGNGVLDVDNPFPYPVRRSITLLGERVNENTLAGSYIETIAGMLPNQEKICIEGTFSLGRKTFEPSQDSVYSYRNATAEIIGKSGVNGIERVITVNDAVNVRSVRSIVNLDPYNIPLSALKITLTSPMGTVLTIHDGDEELNTIVETDQFDDENAKGDWRLNVSWGDTNGERGWFYSWDLSVGGVARYSANGQLVDEEGNPIAGATVSLSGNNEIGTRTTDAEGRFDFGDLTEDDYVVTYSLPGFDGSQSSFMIDDGDAQLGTMTLRTSGANGLSGILAVPSVATAPADVVFVVGHQPAEDETVTSVTWEIERRDAVGNLTTASESSSVGADRRSWTLTQHFDENVYSYTVSATIGTTIRTVKYTYGPTALQHDGLSESSDSARPLDIFLSNCGFIGGGTWPENGFPCLTTADTNAIEYAQMKRDCAAFDIDRYPFSTKNSFDGSGIIDGTKEDTDFFVQEGTPYYRIATQDEKSQPDGRYVPYTMPATGVKRYRMEVTIGGAYGGYIFGEQPARARGMLLQCGRIEE